MWAAKELKKEGYEEPIFDGNDREKFDLLRMVYQKKLNAERNRILEQVYNKGNFLKKWKVTDYDR